MPRRSSSLTQVVDGAIDREINSKYDDVKKVADNIDDVIIVANATATTAAVADNIDSITTIGSSIADIVAVNSNIADVTSVADNIVDMSVVATNIGDIRSVVTTVVPNMAEILLADDRATTATSMAVTAATQAGLANTARVAAEVAKGIAETKATEAGLSAVAADLSADLAAVSEGIASTKADEAVVSAAAAHTSELAAAALLDAFDDRYLGSYSVDPALDNDGQALLDGTLYYNTVSNVLKVYDTSSITWYTIPQVMLSALLDVQLTSVATGDVLSWNGSKWVNTKALTVNSVQLLGGISTQGTMTWNADEETVDVVQNGAILQLGQETQVHVRNNSGSSIADGKVVMATGTLGASGRITAGLYNGAADVKYVLGVATETIANGDDGKVTSFGKIRGINTSAWNEGDVLYATAAGGLTNVAPVTGVKLAVAMVITKHAVNGVIMVRVNGVDELRYEPKNVNIQAHVASTSNPHSVTKAQVGLSNVDNTSDANKPISTTAATEFALKAPLASPALTGTPTAPTAVVGTSTTQLATTAFVNAEIANDTYLKNIQDWRGSMMSKAQFNALASERRANRAGSGFDDMNPSFLDTPTFAPINNNGLVVSPFNTVPNLYGTSSNLFAILDSSLNVNGAIHKVYSQNYVFSNINYGLSASGSNAYGNKGTICALPPAPTIYPYDATLTPEQIASGVIKHADASNSGLIVNGKFDMDTSGWTTYSSTISSNSGKLRINSSVLSGNGEWASQQLSCVIGKTYTVELNYISNTTASCFARMSTSISPTTPLMNRSYDSSFGYKTFTFTATQTSHWIHVGFLGNTTSDIIEFDNIAVFPADAISRSDLVFLESWHEDVSEKDFVYPLGNVQYLGTTGDSGTTVVGAFAGSGTYSLFGNWQADSALVGKGYVWSTLSDANKKAFVSNPENNMYLDGATYVQVRYRVRVVQGLGDSWTNVDPQISLLYYNSLDLNSVKPKGKNTSIVKDLAGRTQYTQYGFNTVKDGGWYARNEASGAIPLADLAYEGKCYAIPIALVHR